MSSISELQKQAHENSKSKGFWDGPFNMGEKLMLITSEVSEALEADRTGNYAIWDREEPPIMDGPNVDVKVYSDLFELYVKNTLADELADAVIRIMDLCEYKGIDLQWHIKAKMKYNSTRPHMHGKKY